MVRFTNNSSCQPLNINATTASSSVSTKQHKMKKIGRRSTSAAPARSATELEKLSLLVKNLSVEARSDLAQQALSKYSQKKASDEASVAAGSRTSSRSKTSDIRSLHHLEDISCAGSIKSSKSKTITFDDNASIVSSLSMASAFRKSAMKRAGSLKLKRNSVIASQA